MHACTRCGGSVGDAFRFCPWCAAPQRLKLVEFFRSAPFEQPDKLLRVSRYLHDDLEERHVRFSIWHDARADAAVSLDDDEPSGSDGSSSTRLRSRGIRCGASSTA
jgi:hypothetical protein